MDKRRKEVEIVVPGISCRMSEYGESGEGLAPCQHVDVKEMMSRSGGSTMLSSPIVGKKGLFIRQRRGRLGSSRNVRR